MRMRSKRLAIKYKIKQTLFVIFIVEKKTFDYQVRN